MIKEAAGPHRLIYIKPSRHFRRQVKHRWRKIDGKLYCIYRSLFFAYMLCSYCVWKTHCSEHCSSQLSKTIRLHTNYQCSILNIKNQFNKYLKVSRTFIIHIWIGKASVYIIFWVLGELIVSILLRKTSAHNLITSMDSSNRKYCSTRPHVYLFCCYTTRVEKKRKV